MNISTLSELAGSLNSHRTETWRGSLRHGPTLPPLILMTDAKRLPDPLPAARALPPGSAVILRHYGTPERAQLARDLARIARQRGLLLLIAADAELAAHVGAAGVHLPQSEAHAARRYRRRPDWLVTVAAHDWQALCRAKTAGADAALLSPVFQTASHPEKKPLGIWRFGALARLSPVPVYALGGVTPSNATSLAATNAVGIAAIGALSR